MRLVLNKSSKPFVKHTDILLITGDGRSLHDDFLKMKGKDYDLACIGRSIKLYPNAIHWFNADGETAIAWAKQIKSESLLTHTLGEVDGFDVDWDIEQPDYQYEAITGQKGRFHGSSALFAALAGIEMGYDKVVLAGCPLDDEGHWYFDDTKGPLWLGHDFMAWVDFSKEPSAKKVRSLSGFTAKIIGDANGWL